MASGSSCVQGLAVSSVSSSVAIFLKELLGLLLNLRVHDHRTLGPDAKQDKAALQHIWEGPGLYTLWKLSYSLICLCEPSG